VLAEAEAPPVAPGVTLGADQVNEALESAAKAAAALAYANHALAQQSLQVLTQPGNDARNDLTKSSQILGEARGYAAAGRA
jgi:hypothetical protein